MRGCGRSEAIRPRMDANEREGKTGFEISKGFHAVAYPAQSWGGKKPDSAPNALRLLW